MADLWAYEDADVTVLDDDEAWEVESDEEQRPKRKKAQASNRPSKRISITLDDDDEGLDVCTISDDEDPIVFTEIPPSRKSKRTAAAKGHQAAATAPATVTAVAGIGSKASNGTARGREAGTSGSGGRSSNSMQEAVCLDEDAADCEAHTEALPLLSKPAARKPGAALSYLDPNAAAVLRKNQDMLAKLKRAAALEVSPSPEPPELPAASKQQLREAKQQDSEAEADALLAKLAGSKGGAPVASTSGAAATAAAAAVEEQGPKVTLVFRCSNGQVKIRTGAADPFGRVFDKYKQHAKGQGWVVKGKQPRFMFDGDKLTAQQTAGDLDIEDDDLIEVHWS